MTLAGIVLTQQIIVKSVANQQNKQDYAEVRHIKYGLFSVNEWKKHLAVIFTEELQNLDLSKSNEVELKKHVEVQLDALIDKVEEKIRKSNKGTVKGWLKQSVIDTVVDMKDIKAGIPDYADEIIRQMTKPKAERKLKSAVEAKVKGFMNETFEEQDLSALKDIFARTATPGKDAARVQLENVISKGNAHIFYLGWIFIACAALQFAMSLIGKKSIPAPQYILLTITLLALLIVGVSTPMIDMEAKISSMKFMLLDHPVTFENQILFFQTKSILDVFWIMITHQDFQMKVVGVLMVLFSIVFPVLKLISSILYYYDFHKARTKKWIHFFVMKSGKWSMTDVLIVAIFMAYIGFNGIISSQFAKLEEAGQDVVLVATNGTTLQAGFYLFLTYAILALFLSTFLSKMGESKVGESKLEAKS